MHSIFTSTAVEIAPRFTAGFPSRAAWSVAASGALLALNLGFAASAGAQGAGAATTVERPKVVPAEFNGDLRMLPKAPSGPVAPKIYRPLLKGPPSTKSAGGAELNAPGSPPGARPPMPAPTQNFAGMNFGDLCTGRQRGGGWAADD